MALHRYSTLWQTIFSVCFLFGVGAPLNALAQARLNRPAPRYFQLTPPDQKEGASILREMRAADSAGDYYFDFELRVLPRRGDETRVSGRLWGSRNREGPVTRMALAAPAGVVGASESRILVQGGPRPSAWQWPATDGAAVIAVDQTALFSPLAGTGLSAFDLQMPFLYWEQFVYEGKTRLNDRPVHTFLLYPPESLERYRPDLAAVRVYLDPQYHALVRAEQIGGENRVLKSFSLGGLVKIDERWMPRSFELRDETTRDKTRFVVTAAALGLDFAGDIFDPGDLAAPLRSPAKITRLAE